MFYSTKIMRFPGHSLHIIRVMLKVKLKNVNLYSFYYGFSSAALGVFSMLVRRSFVLAEYWQVICRFLVG